MGLRDSTDTLYLPVLPHCIFSAAVVHVTGRE
jgi:hypothetical protein